MNINIRQIDHIVIPVEDIQKSILFYTDILGMKLDCSNNRYVVKFGNQKINLHAGKAEFLPAAKNPTFGSTDICFLAEGNIYDLKAELEAKGVCIEEGVVKRTGAQGAISSIYFRDPDGNLIEISTII